MAAPETALTIRRNFERAPADLLRIFGKVPTGNVCDSQGRIGALDYRIKPVSAARAFCGSALPVDAGPRDNLAAWAALEVARPGDVILIRTGEFCDSSVIGDVFAGMAKNGGVAADRHRRGRARHPGDRCGRHPGVRPRGVAELAAGRTAPVGWVCRSRSAG